MLWMLIVWLIFGLVVGALARFLVPGNQPMSVAATIGLGVAGSFFGGLLGNLLLGYPLLHVHAAGFLGSVCGATLLLFLVRTLHRRTVQL